MTQTDPNTIRALAILATHPDALDFDFSGRQVKVAGQFLHIDHENDRVVLNMLAATSEFGFAMTGVEDCISDLRAMQREWIEKAKDLSNDEIMNAANVLSKQMRIGNVESYEIGEAGDLTWHPI